MAATHNVHRVRHLSTDAFVRQLRRIRATDTENAILVVTEGIFSMNGDSPDLAALQTACREYDATLLVDAAHDLGAVGPGGTGAVGLQGLLGKVDLVIGSFSKVFAANGGFAATSSAAISEYLRAGAPSRTFSNAISPHQCAAVLKAVEIVRSAEGDLLRDKVSGLSLTFCATRLPRRESSASAIRDRLCRHCWDERRWGGSRRPCVSTMVYSRI